MDYEFYSTIRGYHHYKTVWVAVTGQLLQVEREVGNSHDVYAVCVRNDDNTVVGHVPRKYSRIFWSFLNRGGYIEAVVTGPRKFANDLAQGVLRASTSFVTERKG